MSELMSVV